MKQLYTLFICVFLSFSVGFAQDTTEDRTIIYFNDFETDASDWNIPESWIWGTPQKTEINSASSGLKAIFSAPTDGDYLNDIYVGATSPKFDFSTVYEPRISFDIHFKTEEDFDGVAIIATVDSINYRIDPSEFSVNWYNSSPTALNDYGLNQGWSGDSEGYIHVENDLNFLSGISNVIFQIVLATDKFVTDEGVSIDNFKIDATNYQEDDFIASRLGYNTSGCDETEDAFPYFSVISTFSEDQLSVPVIYVINGDTSNVEIIPVVEKQTTTYFEFTQNYSIAQEGDYSIEVILLVEDADSENDSIREEFVQEYTSAGTLVISNDTVCDNENFTLSAIDAYSGYYEFQISTDSGLNYSAINIPIDSNTITGIYGNISEAVDAYFRIVAFDCKSDKSNVIVLHVVPGPELDFVTQRANIIEGESITLFAEATEDIFWYSFENGDTTLVGEGPSFTTPKLYSPTFFFVQADNGDCQSQFTSINIDVHPSKDMVFGQRMLGASGNVKFLASPSVNVVWIMGDNGLVYKTVDAGINVEKFEISVDPNGNYGASSIAAIDENNAWALFFDESVGKGFMYNTSDGGKTWNQQLGSDGESLFKSFGNVVHFFDAQNGVAMGDQLNGVFEMFTTNDGGDNWTQVNALNIPTPLDLDEIGVVNIFEITDNNTIYYPTNRGRILMSSDFGNTWTVTNPSGATDNNGNFYTLFYDQNEGYLYNRFASDSVFKTIDGGQSWRKVKWFNFSIEIFKLVKIKGTKSTIIGNVNGFEYDIAHHIDSLEKVNNMFFAEAPIQIERSKAEFEFHSVKTGYTLDFTYGPSLLYFNGFSEDNQLCENDPDTIIVDADFCMGDSGTLVLEAPNGYASYLWSTGEETLTIEVPMIEEIYSVNAYDSNGCSYSSQIEVISDSLPAEIVDFSIDPTTICDSNTLINISADLENSDRFSVEFSTDEVNYSTVAYSEFGEDLSYSFKEDGFLRIVAHSGCGDDISESVFVEFDSLPGLVTITNDTICINTNSTVIVELSQPLTENQFVTWFQDGNLIHTGLSFEVSYDNNGIQEFDAYVNNEKGCEVFLGTASLRIDNSKNGCDSNLNNQIVGYTTFDLQSNSAMQRRILAYPDNTVSAVWTMSNVYDSGFPDRGTGYNHFDGTNWGPFPSARIESNRTGWPTISLDGNGKETIFSHVFTGRLNLVELKNTGKGSSSFTESYPFLNSGSNIWAKSANVDSFIYVISNSNGGAQDSNVVSSPMYYSKSNDNGTSFVIDHVALPGYESPKFSKGSSDGYFIDAKDSIVAIVYNDGNINFTALWKSVDYGETFELINVDSFPYNASVEVIEDTDNDGVTDTLDASRGQVNVIIDNNNEVHVFWNSSKVFGQNNQMFLAYGKDYNVIKHWSESETTPKVIGQVLDCDLDGEVTNGFDYTSDGASYGRHNLTLTPQAGIDAENNLFVVYAANVEGDEVNGQNYRDLFVVFSKDNGVTWSLPQNVTQSLGMEDVYPSIARNVTDKLHILWHQDDEPGNSAQGDPISLTEVKYAGVSKSALLNHEIGAQGCEIPTPRPRFFSDEVHCDGDEVEFIILNLASYNADTTYIDFGNGQSAAAEDTMYVKYEPGSYTVSLFSIKGVDTFKQIITDYITVGEVFEEEEIVEICEGEEYFTGGNFQSEDGFYVDSLVSQFGCDSIVTVQLIVNPNFRDTVQVNICEGDTMVIDGEEVSETGLYEDYYSSESGCDSIIVIDLFVAPLYKDTFLVEICEGESYQVEGKEQTESGIYSDNLFSEFGCDSTVVIDLTVIPTLRDTTTVEICQGESYFAAGADQTVTGLYVDSFKYEQGCDSLMFTNLIVKPLPEVDLGDDVLVCLDDSVTLDGGEFVAYLWSTGDSTRTISFTASEDQFIALGVQGANGCLNIDSVNIKLDTIQVVAGFDFEADTTDAIVFTSSSPNANSYGWNFGDDDTSSAQNPTHAYDTAGTYIVTLIVTNTCTSDTITKEVVFEKTVGIAQLLAKAWKVYPNPVQNELNIELPLDWSKGSIQIHDVVGRLVKSKQVEPGVIKQTLSVNDLIPGSYLVKWVSSEGEFVKTLIKR